MVRTRLVSLKEGNPEKEPGDVLFQGSGRQPLLQRLVGPATPGLHVARNGEPANQRRCPSTLIFDNLVGFKVIFQEVFFSHIYIYGLPRSLLRHSSILDADSFLSLFF